MQYAGDVAYGCSSPHYLKSMIDVIHKKNIIQNLVLEDNTFFRIDSTTIFQSVCTKCQSL